MSYFIPSGIGKSILWPNFGKLILKHLLNTVRVFFLVKQPCMASWVLYKWGTDGMQYTNRTNQPWVVKKCFDKNNLTNVELLSIYGH